MPIYLDPLQRLAVGQVPVGGNQPGPLPGMGGVTPLNQRQRLDRMMEPPPSPPPVDPSTEAFWRRWAEWDRMRSQPPGAEYPTQPAAISPATPLSEPNLMPLAAQSVLPLGRTAAQAMMPSIPFG